MLLAAAAGALGAGCIGLSTPLLPEDVSAGIADHPMRRMETSDVVLYYPEGRRDEATRFLGRIERCAGYEKGWSLIHNRLSDEKMLVLLPEVAFNNAFVVPRLLGYGPLAVWLRWLL